VSWYTSSELLLPAAQAPVAPPWRDAPARTSPRRWVGSAEGVSVSPGQVLRAGGRDPESTGAPASTSIGTKLPTELSASPSGHSVVPFIMHVENVIPSSLQSFVPSPPFLHRQ
jgi:hypothetical protein